ncbi:MAG TPA: PIG-L family deacetylase [Sedimentisphaerales bacterium]|nr:PIG-L family deacetylase [Sedimentisphaerales bacterium]
MKNVLIIAPHPDDAELAMAGTIAKMADSGFNITIVDLTDGEPTPFGSRQIRKSETTLATEKLRIKNRDCLSMPNRYLYPTLKNRKKIAETIRTFQPDILFGPTEPDFHPDHIAAAKLIDGAIFEAKFCKTRLAGEPHWTTKRFGYYSPHRLEYSLPSFIVDITDYWDKKIESIKAYQSQIKNHLPDEISIIEKTEIVCKYFGQSIGAKFGEPFYSYQPLSENILNMKE